MKKNRSIFTKIQSNLKDVFNCLEEKKVFKEFEQILASNSGTQKNKIEIMYIVEGERNKGFSNVIIFLFLFEIDSEGLVSCKVSAFISDQTIISKERRNDANNRKWFKDFQIKLRECKNDDAFMYITECPYNSPALFEEVKNIIAKIILKAIMEPNINTELDYREDKAKGVTNQRNTKNNVNVLITSVE